MRDGKKQRGKENKFFAKKGFGASTVIPHSKNEFLVQE